MKRPEEKKGKEMYGNGRKGEKTAEIEKNRGLGINRKGGKVKRLEEKRTT